MSSLTMWNISDGDKHSAPVSIVENPNLNSPPPPLVDSILERRAFCRVSALFEMIKWEGGREQVYSRYKIITRDPPNKTCLLK